MPTTLPHIRVSASGTLGSGTGNEIWSCSLKVGLTLSGAGSVLVAANQVDCDEVVATAASAWKNFITHDVGASGAGKAACSDWVAVTQIKASPVIASGHDDPALTPSLAFWTSGNRGACSSSLTAQQMGQNPYSVAVVATLLGSLYPKGAAAYGRFYVPGPNLHFNTFGASALDMIDGLMDHTVTVGTTQSWANLMAALLTSINTAVLTSGKVPQVSNISTSTAAAGIRWQPVTLVRVDSRPDTVRRRSNKISGRGEAFASV